MMMMNKMMRTTCIENGIMSSLTVIRQNHDDDEQDDADADADDEKDDGYDDHDEDNLY